MRDSFDCISTPEFIAVNVGTCTSISKIKVNEPGFNVYPNPVKDKLYIHTNNTTVATVEIIDAMGKVVVKESKNFNPDNQAQSLAVTLLPAGIYFVRISPENENATVLRMIKQ